MFCSMLHKLNDKKEKQLLLISLSDMIQFGLPIMTKEGYVPGILAGRNQVATYSENGRQEAIQITVQNARRINQMVAETPELRSLIDAEDANAGDAANYPLIGESSTSVVDRQTTEQLRLELQIQQERKLAADLENRTALLMIESNKYKVDTEAASRYQASKYDTDQTVKSKEKRDAEELRMKEHKDGEELRLQELRNSEELRISQEHLNLKGEEVKLKSLRLVVTQEKAKADIANAARELDIRQQEDVTKKDVADLQLKAAEARRETSKIVSERPANKRTGMYLLGLE